MRKRYPVVLLFLLSLILGCQRSENQAESQPDGQEQASGAGNLHKSEQQKGKPGSLTGTSKSNVANKFWDNRFIFYKDFTGDSSAEVYEAIKGQKYFDDTYIFVYSTLEDMEGTGEYMKIDETMTSTTLDDRIFIWVHLDADKKVLFVRKLISDNIKDKIDQGTKEL